jgi:serine/threonine-protein kinase
MSMELDDFKQAWQSLDRRLEQQHVLNLQLFHDGQLDKTRRGLRPLKLGQGVQILVGAMLMLLAAPFWVQHRDTPHLLTDGLLVHGYGLISILFAARTLYLINRVDYAAPVLTIQQQLGELRAWCIRCSLWFSVAWCFFWIPLLLLFFYWLGADVWVTAPLVVYALIASGFASLGLACGLIRWSRHPRRSRLAKYLEDSFAGFSIRRAQAHLDEIARFTKE